MNPSLIRLCLKVLANCSSSSRSLGSSRLGVSMRFGVGWLCGSVCMGVAAMVRVGVAGCRRSGSRVRTNVQRAPRVDDWSARRGTRVPSAAQSHVCGHVRCRQSRARRESAAETPAHADGTRCVWVSDGPNAYLLPFNRLIFIFRNLAHKHATYYEFHNSTDHVCLSVWFTTIIAPTCNRITKLLKLL